MNNEIYFKTVEELNNMPIMEDENLVNLSKLAITYNIKQKKVDNFKEYYNFLEQEKKFNVLSNLKKKSRI
jgi:hypothetical protein